MHGLTAYITDRAWVDSVTTWYVLVDDAYGALVAHVGRLPQHGPTPSFSNSEGITIALLAEPFFHANKELCLRFIRQYHRDLFPCLRDDTRVNRRRRARIGMTAALRRVYTTWLLKADDPVRIVDSAPILVDTYMRSRSCATVAGAQ